MMVGARPTAEAPRQFSPFTLGAIKAETKRRNTTQLSRMGGF
jgi:hypothetical protein